VSFEDAARIVAEHAAALRPSGKELVDLLDAAGSVLAEPVEADRNFPPFSRATRDGYAVRTADVPGFLKIAGEIRAGQPLADIPAELQAGQAFEIMTGAPVPAGADAVVMIEYTTREGDGVVVQQGVRERENIVPAGAEAHRGAKLLLPGAAIDPAAIALSASAGRTRLLVYSRPRVGVLATGDEVVDIDVPPQAHQIRNSNSYSLAAQVRAAGGDPTLLPIAPDKTARLRELIVEGLEADLLLLSGGVSMGKYDLVGKVLGELGAEFFIAGAKIQPGKPIVFGRVPKPGNPAAPRAGNDHPHTYFFGLPGNPVSTMVTFALFVRPVLCALAGRSPVPRVFLRARLKAEIRTKMGLTRFLPATLSGNHHDPEVMLASWQGSGDIAALGRNHCFVVIPPDRETIPAGEWVGVMTL
jgi:molybdopterin molybdotransferase